MEMTRRKRARRAGLMAHEVEGDRQLLERHIEELRAAVGLERDV